jgi:hypothetical protein
MISLISTVPESQLPTLLSYQTVAIQGLPDGPGEAMAVFRSVRISFGSASGASFQEDGLGRMHGSDGPSVEKK